MAFDPRKHPLIAQVDRLNELLSDLIRTLPRTRKDSGELERRRPMRPSKDVVYLPGSGNNTGSIDERGPALGAGAPGSQPNAGPDTHNFEGLPGSGGGGGGGW